MSSIVKKVLSSSWSMPNYDYSNIVKDYFKVILGLKHVPNEVIKFYGQCNGFGVYALNDVFSLERISQERDAFFEFIDAMGLEEDMVKYNLVPVADDAMGGYYVFKSSVKDKTIYYLDHENPRPLDECMSFENFNKYLEDLKEMVDSFDEEDNDE